MLLIYPKRISYEAIYRVLPLLRRTLSGVALLALAGSGSAQAAPKEGRVSGTVTDAATRKPVPLAFVTVLGSKLPPVASDATDGFFITYELSAVTHTLRVTHEGYRPTEMPVVVQAGKILQVQVELSPLPKKTRFLINVCSQNVAISAKVKLRGPTEAELPTTGADGGMASIEVPPGRYVASVTADGYLAQIREAEVAEGAEQSLMFDLRREPSKRAVTIKGKKIEVGRRIHFASSLADILPDSYPTLDEVVDAIVRNDLRRIRVEGHTDNEGSRARNLLLSQQRAQAVANYLVKSGIEEGRIETKGYGDARPMVPNVTARGREINRRIEFHILEGGP